MSTENNIRNLRKFTFSDNFAAPKPQKQVEPSFSAAELEAARAEGRAEGEAAGYQAAMASIEKMLADNTGLISQSLGGLFSAEAARREQMKMDAAGLAHAFARKIAPRAFADAPLDEIAAMVTEFIGLCYHEARIVIRVADPMVDPLKELSAQLANEQGYMGKIVILGDPRMQGSDCKIEWADGGAERSEAKIMDELDRLVSRYMDARRRALASGNHAEQIMEQDHDQY